MTFLPARVALRQILLLSLLAAPAAAQIRLPKVLGGSGSQHDSVPRTDSASRSAAAPVENGSPRQSMEKFFQLGPRGALEGGGALPQHRPDRLGARR